MLDGSKNLYEKIERKYCLFMIPVLCNRILKDENVLDITILEFIRNAKPELHEERNIFYRNSKIINDLYFTIEEKKSVDIVFSLKDKELLGYYRALKYMEKYLKDHKKTNIINAKRVYLQSESIWRRLLLEMTDFIILNLYGRKSFNLA